MKKFFFDIFKIIVIFLSLWIWLFVGIETFDGIHGTDYIFFFKKHATLQVFFKDGVLSDPQMDLIDINFDKLNQEDLNDFNRLCFYRYGLQPVKYCYEYIYETPDSPEKDMFYKENVFFQFMWDD